ncbi:MAG: AMP-binding protein, partial [Gammaproteobacteria bacterium]|nr:AMP-binding protein [Gammaproteobacteria bacterium]
MAIGILAIGILEIDCMTLRLETLLMHVARTHPDAPCVYFGRSVYSYRDIDNRANQIGQVLRGLGVVRGDRVGEPTGALEQLRK